MLSASDRLITFPSGLVLPVEPWLLVLDLEQRGLTVTAEGDDIVIRPRGRLTEADRQALRRWKYHVLALLVCEAPRCA